MKANKAPEKIWMSDDTEAIWVTNPYSTRFIEYTRTDAFIERADKFISSFFHPDDTELKKGILDEFHKYMKGE